jgi:hypothetical protein
MLWPGPLRLCCGSVPVFLVAGCSVYYSTQSARCWSVCGAPKLLQTAPVEHGWGSIRVFMLQTSPSPRRVGRHSGRMGIADAACSCGLQVAC